MAWQCVCGRTNEDTTILCDCGVTKYKALQKTDKSKRTTTTSPSPSAAPGISASDGMSGFFSFRKMVSTQIIKALYFIGMLALTLGGLAGLASSYDESIVAGLLALTAGNLLWRILCEGWILLFSMHDILGSIEKLQQGNS